jgi:hypothetical protein
MRALLLIFLVVGLAAAFFAVTGPGSAVATDNGLSVGKARPPIPPKPDGPFPVQPEVPRVQGDTVVDPFVIAAIPFAATGVTCSFNNDYDYACPYTGSTAADVVYKYVCGASTGVSIGLCQSTYDTKVYVYEDAVGTPIACNDDYCEYQSYLANVPLTAGHTYYIVVDGYGTSCGNYYLEFGGTSSGCCHIECPAGAIPESEPDCYENYEDTYNGGCNSDPFAFLVLQPSDDPIVICGTTGVYEYYTTVYRDTDWFELNLTESANICLAGDCEMSSYFFIIDGRNGCEDPAIVASSAVGMCMPIEDLCYFCDVGTWWMWAGPSTWELWGCGHVYWMEITGYICDPSPTTDTTWGRVKGLFR